MAINCSPNKTELICFDTTEKDRSQILSSLPLGDKPIMFVTEKKVLIRVMIDEDLTYKCHSKMIQRSTSASVTDGLQSVSVNTVAATGALAKG